MVKRALSAGAGFLGLCLPLFAQQTFVPDTFSSLNNYSSFCPPSLMLSDGGPFSFASAVAPMSFNWVEAVPSVDLPALTVKGPQRAAYASTTSGKDSSKEVVDVRPPKFTYADGEVGFLYGRSSGKFGRDVEEGYIMGEVGNDKFNITAGASYEQSSGRIPRWGR
jgi:hypothetical protein